MKTEDRKRQKLRQQAETRLHARHKDPLTLPPDQLPILVHELEVHQIELEMQNEELQRAHLELVIAKDRFANLFEFAPVGYLILDVDGRILNANLACSEMFNMPRSELQGRHISQFVYDNEHSNTVHHHLQHVFSTQGRQSCEVEAILGDETRVYAKLDSIVEPGITGADPQCLTLISDITELKRAEIVSREAKKVAEDASQAKSRFLAAASHDLRQPLQAMTIISDVLRMKLIDKETSELVANLSDCLNDMSSMFNALLNLSQLDTGTIPVKVRALPVHNLLRRIENVYRPLADRKGLCLRIAWSSAIIHSDPTLLGQILDNLVSNAIRYTTAGKVLVGCRHNRSRLRIEVWDTGAGIPEDDHEQVFDEYYQLSNPARDYSKGLGLGLAIAKRSAQLIGTQIELKSWSDGSLFSVEVPLESHRDDVYNSAKEINTAVTAPGRSLLVIDDNSIVLYALTHILESYGYKVAGAKTGKEAIELLKKRNGGFELLITDYRLPNGLTGLELIKTIRRSLGLSIPALIVTGDLDVASMQEIISLDLRVLQKPVPAEILNKYIQEMLG